MKEIACQFGEKKNLVGVFAPAIAGDKKDTAFIFVSAGILSKIGPHRLYVLMARKLAQKGFPSMRFDLGGIGESEVDLAANLSLHERSISEIQQAMTYVTELSGIKRFVLCGLCSGAEDSFKSAVIDERVSGLYLIDPHGFETKKSKLRYNIFRASRKLVMLTGWYSKRVTGVAEENKLDDEVDFQDEISQEVAEEKTQILLKRGVHIKYVYTGGVYSYFNYANQFYDMYPNIKKTDLVDVEILDKLGHLPLLDGDKITFVNSICRWAKKIL